MLNLVLNHNSLLCKVYITKPNIFLEADNKQKSSPYWKGIMWVLKGIGWKWSKYQSQTRQLVVRPHKFEKVISLKWLTYWKLVQTIGMRG